MIIKKNHSDEEQPVILRDWLIDVQNWKNDLEKIFKQWKLAMFFFSPDVTRLEFNVRHAATSQNPAQVHYLCFSALTSSS